MIDPRLFISGRLSYLMLLSHAFAILVAHVGGEQLEIAKTWQ